MVIQVNPLDRIVSNKGVCGGAACVQGTRVPVWLLERYRQLGMNAAEITEDYPFLSADDIQAAWKYAAAHQSDIARQAKDNEGS